MGEEEPKPVDESDTSVVVPLETETEMEGIPTALSPPATPSWFTPKRYLRWISMLCFAWLMRKWNNRKNGVLNLECYFIMFGDKKKILLCLESYICLVAVQFCSFINNFNCLGGISIRSCDGNESIF